MLTFLSSRHGLIWIVLLAGLTSMGPESQGTSEVSVSDAARAIKTNEERTSELTIFSASILEVRAPHATDIHLGRRIKSDEPVTILRIDSVQGGKDPRLVVGRIIFLAGDLRRAPGKPLKERRFRFMNSGRFVLEIIGC